MTKVTLEVNGKKVSKEVPDHTLLSVFLRDNLNLTGTHVGCDTSQCGACVVHVDGKSIKSCSTLAADIEGSKVTTIEGLAKDGVENIHVISPAFSSDCLETIEELNEENREIFMENGGREFGYIPCLNDREDHINLLTSLLENELHGWV